MNGAEHAREAERLASGATDLAGEVGIWSLGAMYQLAQVHATLALAYYVGQFVERATTPPFVPSDNTEGSGEPS